MEVKDEVQLAYIAEVAVQDFDKMVYDIQHDQFVVVLLYAAREVQRRISTTLWMYMQLVRGRHSC